MQPESFARLVAEALEASGLSLRKFAAELGVTHPAVKNWLGGELPNEEHVEALAATGFIDEDRVWMTWLQDRRRRAATLVSAADNGANPGWMCLPPLTAISATVARTLVPFLPRPLAHPA